MLCGFRLTNRWLSMKKDIASCGSKYLAYSEVEVEYQGSSGLLLQPELWVVEGLTLEKYSTFGKKDKLEPSYVGTFEIFGYIGPTGDDHISTSGEALFKGFMIEVSIHELCTDIAKITRKRSKPGKHRHGNGKSAQEPEVSRKESSAARTDNRHPMLVESDYDSWKIRIHRYIRGKPLGKLIWNSIQNGPSPHPMVTNAPTEGQTGVNMPIMKLDSEFTPEETNCENADTQAEIILNQGLPRHIFNILNQTNTAKEIWDNVVMLMQGSGRTLQQRKEDLFDEFERFRAIGNEPIHDYFVRFHKLGKYVTNVKQNMDISTTNYVHIYTHLKAYEPHATKTLKKQEQSSSIINPLAYMAQATPTTSLPPLSTSQPQPAILSPNDAMMATMTHIANLLSGFQKQFPPTNNQLRSSSNSRTHATVHDGQIVTETVQRRAPGNVGNTTGKKVICYNCRGEGHVARQCKEPKRAKDSQYFKDKMLLMEAKEKGVTLDAEAEAFLANVECTAPYDQPLAMATTNIFEVNHEDAYDSDVDEGPNAAAAFMANLSSTSGNNHHVNEVHPNAIQINDSVNYQLSHEMHHEEQSDSDVESELDDNTTLYHQLELERRAKVVPTEVSTGSSANISMVTILDEMREILLDEKTPGKIRNLSLKIQNLTAELAQMYG
ncbi:retrovirus-related pol polyprotein from transposon TNT 1-94 [Tanacetum coccineum]